MPFSVICCDASLIFRLVTGTSQAISIVWDDWTRQRISFVAPLLFRYELTNACYGHYVRGGNSLEDCQYFLETGLLLPISIDDDLTVHSSAMSLADRYGLPATYDAHYLAAAEKHQATLWTSDKKLFNRVNGKLTWVRYIE